VTRDRSWILQHIPHQGRMCLLDEVRSWDRSQVECAARTQGAADHPLRLEGRLGAGCALEYAAQAMAVHGALLRPSGSTGIAFGLLTSARELDLFVVRLDDLDGELLVQARAIQTGSDSALYAFSLRHTDRLLARGRASLWFGAASPPAP
jgi:predicted hotdog family 3-hydroxylacyl-ACP dehydratase